MQHMDVIDQSWPSKEREEIIVKCELMMFGLDFTKQGWPSCVMCLIQGIRVNVVILLFAISFFFNLVRLAWQSRWYSYVYHLILLIAKVIKTCFYTNCGLKLNKKIDSQRSTKLWCWVAYTFLDDYIFQKLINFNMVLPSF